MLSIRACGLTLGIFGAASMFFLAWWLILTGNAEGPTTLFERIYIGYSFTRKVLSKVRLFKRIYKIVSFF